MNEGEDESTSKDDAQDSSNHTEQAQFVSHDKYNRPYYAHVPKRLEPSGNEPSASQDEASTSYASVSISSRADASESSRTDASLNICQIKPKKVETPSPNIHTNESQEVDKPSRKLKSKLCNYIRNNEFGADFIFEGPFGSVPLTYLDYTASGRPLQCIESYLQRYVLPTYANTHTESSLTGQQTTSFREEARDIIRKALNAGKDDFVIFTGSGATTAINKLVHLLNFEKEEDVFVFIGPYEHHSNILPWVDSKAKVVRIPQNEEGLLDLQALASKLEEVTKKQKSCSKRSKLLIIGAFSAASNVTGIHTPIDTVSSLIHKYKGFVLWDYACAGPYVTIDMNPVKKSKHEEPYKDAVFISPHKFVGGPGTPGVLVAKRWLFRNPVPHVTGGGTVLFVRRDKHIYLNNPEHREEGGTPSIIESIRSGLVFKLKQELGTSYIMKKEHLIFSYTISVLQKVEGLIILGNLNAPRLPILPILFYNNYTGRFLHQDFVATMFNDLFGIQVRSGCACAGPYGLDLMGMSEQNAQKFEDWISLKKEENLKQSHKALSSNTLEGRNLIYKPGFTRFSLPYFIQNECLDFTLKAMQLVALYGWSLLPQYDYDAQSSKWTFSGSKVYSSRKSLHDASFSMGAMTVDETDSSSSEHDDVDYGTILRRAEGIFYDAVSGHYRHQKKHEDLLGNEELRWFMTPQEAVDIISQRNKYSRLEPEDLPFMPGALAVKLGINPRGHKARHGLDKHFPVEYFPDTK